MHGGKSVNGKGCQEEEMQKTMRRKKRTEHRPGITAGFLRHYSSCTFTSCTRHPPSVFPSRAHTPAFISSMRFLSASRTFSLPYFHMRFSLASLRLPNARLASHVLLIHFGLFHFHTWWAPTSSLHFPIVVSLHSPVNLPLFSIFAPPMILLARVCSSTIRSEASDEWYEWSFLLFLVSLLSSASLQSSPSSS